MYIFFFKKNIIYLYIHTLYIYFLNLYLNTNQPYDWFIIYRYINIIYIYIPDIRHIYIYHSGYIVFNNG